MLKIKIYLLFFVLALASCKIKYSFKGITIPPEAKSISVDVFTNNATLTNPNEAMKFTQKLRDAVSSQTNLALVKQNGDLRFEGYISDYTVAPVAIQSGDQAALNRLTITIMVKYFNKFEPAKNFERPFTRFFDYKSNQNLTSIENTALDEINKQITEDVFNAAFNNW